MSKSDLPAKILDYLFVGGKVHAKNRGLLKDYKITHVLNMTPPRRRVDVARVDR